MGLFDFLFKGNKQESEEKHLSKIVKEENDDFVDVAPYIEATKEEAKLVSLIATSIATGDSPESSFVVKKVLKRNPEAKKISLIAASIAAIESNGSPLVVKRIQKRKGEKEC
ncbi:hypothetical protein [Vagococcus carniphilus]|uniref:Uncharacterized protein n=1 Tax=Vagococcus carniphilus TaxID=218144 RepID=A0A430B886_9ENTE|nr:hypothetical protein [Vagococcus carniphilus]MDT2864396.1 hypothetical protein [Vagococcus carniphilus]QNN74164.1 hypothetical protein H9L18_06165 [Vagococcus carniphilus]RSU16529.1 hypothetical protein CBF28_03100 [Vagococcus carniphilus]